MNVTKQDNKLTMLDVRVLARQKGYAVYYGCGSRTAVIYPVDAHAKGKSINVDMSDAVLGFSRMREEIGKLPALEEKVSA